MNIHGLKHELAKNPREKPSKIYAAQQKILVIH